MVLPNKSKFFVHIHGGLIYFPRFGKIHYYNENSRKCKVLFDGEQQIQTINRTQIKIISELDYLLKIA